MFIADSSRSATLPSRADTGKRAKSLYGVARKRADLLKMSLVASAAMWVICLLALGETTNTARAEGSLPENGKIAFVRFVAEGREIEGREIYTVEPDGSNLSRLTKEGEVEDYETFQPAWSPDGTKVAYYSGDSPGHQDVYVMNADGSEQTNITQSTRKANFNPTWSPDGTRIAFESNRDGGLAIYTMKPDGSDVTQLTTNLGGDFEPTWQPLPGTTVDQPDTGGSSLLLVASALLFSGGVLLYAGVKRWM